MFRTDFLRRTALFVLVTGVVALLVAGALLWRFDRLLMDQARAELLERVARRAKVLEVIDGWRPRPHPADPAQNAHALVLAGIQQGMDLAAFHGTGRMGIAWRTAGGTEFHEIGTDRAKFGPPRVEAGAPGSPPLLGLEGKSGLSPWRNPDGVSVLAAYAPIGAEGLALIGTISMAELREPQWRAVALTLALAAILIVIVSGFYVWVTSGLERRLDSQRRLFESVLDAMPQRVFVKDRERRYVMVNAAYLKDQGASLEQVIGRRAAETGLFEASNVEMIAKLDAEAFEKGEPMISPHVQFAGRDGKAWVFNITRAPIRDQRGRVVQIVGVMDDVTAVLDARREAERALARSERRFRALFAYVPVGIYETDTAAKLLIVNERMTAITGLSSEQLLARGWEAAIHPEDLDRVRKAVAEITATARPFPVEFRFVTPEGRAVWVEANVIALRDEHGGITGYLGAITDLTRRKRAEAAQVQSYNLMSAVSRAQSNYIAATRTDEIFSGALEDLLTITGSSHAMIGEQRGIADPSADGDPQQAGARPWEIVIRQGRPPGDENEAVIEPLRRLIAQVCNTRRPAALSLPDALAPGSPRAFVALPVLHGKRMMATIGLVGRAEGYDESLLRFLEPILFTYGAILQAMRNDRRRQLAEAAIVQKNQQLESIFANMAEGIVILDRTGRVVQLNRLTRSMLDWNGIPPHEPEHLEALFGFRHPDGRPYSGDQLAMVRALKERQTIIGQQVSISRPWGDVALLVSASPLFDEDRNVSGVVAILSDITELKKLDELKSEFIATVSHELRTPLAAILGYVHLILEGDAGGVTEDQRKYLEIVSRNTTRLTQLINDLLDVEKIESGKSKLNQAVLNLSDLLLEAESTFRALAKQKGLRLETRIGGNLRIVGDGDRLTQVFTNLLSNAVKYTPAGEVRLAAERIGDEVRVTVADTGIGMTPDSLGKLFTKFYRAEDDYARQAGGTGLGLVISRAIVAQHAGRIEVSSVHGQGTEFRVFLPSTLADSERDSRAPAGEAQPGAAADDGAD